VLLPVWSRLRREGGSAAVCSRGGSSGLCCWCWRWAARRSLRGASLLAIFRVGCGDTPRPPRRGCAPTYPAMWCRWAIVAGAQAFAAGARDGRPEGRCASLRCLRSFCLDLGTPPCPRPGAAPLRTLLCGAGGQSWRGAQAFAADVRDGRPEGRCASLRCLRSFCFGCGGHPHAPAQGLRPYVPCSGAGCPDLRSGIGSDRGVLLL
jgi:hypothetical protein